MAANAEGLEWRQARQYLINSGVIPPTHRVTKPDVDLVDFARSLRDGVFLCSLLNIMKPNCVEDWSPRPLMQHYYLRNIAAFLQACKKHFNLQDLFVETDLYEVDNFKKVMQVLSRLSHSPEALGLGWVPFPRKEQRNYYNQVANEESIYASLQDVTSSHDRLYANVDELYDHNPEEEEDPYSYGNESIYDSICYYQAQPQAGKATDVDEKKSFILAELYETEKNVVRVLNLICHSYHGAVKALISPEDCRLLFDTAQQLYPVHCSLLEGLERSQEMKNDSSRAVADVTQHFLNQHSGFLHYGQYAVRLPFAIERAKLLQTRGDTAKAMMSVQQNSGPSERKFPLSDLLHVPIQRVLKYPLLMNELLKCVQKQSLPSSQAEKVNLNTVIDQLEDLARYINSTKGDAEDMKQIEEVEQSFSEPLRTPLLQCGRYRLDGELKVKAPCDNGSSKKWVFLFDKVMLVCRKPRAVFDQRYVVKTVYEVAQLRVEPMLHQPRTKGQFGLQIYYGGTLEIEVFTKTDEMKSRWMEAIKQAKEVTAPQNSNRGNHSFELTTFEEACLCDVCGKLLCGCYFQGYYCQACKKSAHYSCLASVRACSSMHPPALPPSRHPALAPRHSLQGTEPPPPSPRNQFPRRGTSLHEPDLHGGHPTIFVAKQRYDAIGHRQSRILTFDRGEELEVTNPVPGSEWWEATSLRTGRQGEVPSSYLSKKHDDLNLDQMSEEERIRTFSWYGWLVWAHWSHCERLSLSLSAGSLERCLASRPSSVSTE
ncbi:Guanine nucleotide exchange factor VAV2 [Geodia barretti]|uniref:Guanine nucleotide exchange factor VAV2 n=1 Tax=Geodia barretti TaxID=519541 RepID=A0AA35TM62_GEOBA|nr:Guanine nucleotide exchange factor VAV2 [Geodia barretti]